jgi:cytochrome c peroxidase
MKKSIVLLLAAITAGIFSCKKDKSIQGGGGGTVTLELPETPYPYFGSDMSLNRQATLGRVLFYEKRLSLNNSLSCASCHKQGNAFSDNVAQSRGYENRLTNRNSLPIQNLGAGGFGGGIFFPGGGGSFFWDARENDLAKLVSRPISNHVEMGIEDLSTIPAKLAALPYYKQLFDDAYGSDEITVDKMSQAMSTFMFAITSTNTRFDRAVMQPSEMSHIMTAQEQQGMVLFNTTYNCAGCHNPALGGYSSASFMNIGLDYPVQDKGIGVISGNARDNGSFKIPNLRNIALTAPYMHDGRFASLDQVLEHYSHGIKADPNLDQRLKAPSGQPIRMNISDNDKKALIAFLNTLTDYDMISDAKLSNPFKTN